MRLAAVLLIACGASAAAEPEKPADKPATKKEPRYTKEEMDAHMEAMHKFWCDDGGNWDTSLCKEVALRRDALRAGEEPKRGAGPPAADEVKAMHEAFCAIEANAELHPCLAWASKGNRDRRRNLMKRKFKPE
eukprot:CAMPEP_0119276730 /NCGR_PEP_ID=MMETSP1329-20130426/15841_1 /TAXON_ID=114041 /ORGANISM="Genus nov. species nov., Strain RCC1024" /LENGTH=132 /DNA_ID=CAMNT_0007277167 /DNA_START=130 /DNA_END=525 /DNA_ORIENTATION=-